MSPSTVLGSLVAVAAMGLAMNHGSVPRDESPMQGKLAPAFAASTAAGKSFALKTLTAKGPVFLYFIKKDCPTNARAEKYYNRIFEASGGKANIIGVINADAEQYEAWDKRFKAPFPVVLDPQKKVIGAFQAERSPWVVEVGTSGKIAKVWEGYSEPMLKELFQAMAGNANWSAANFSGTPMEPAYG